MSKLTERNQEMMRLRYQEHWTLQDIGDKYGVSKERVRQLTGTNDGHWNRSQKLLEWDKKKAEYIRQHPELTTEQLVNELHMSDGSIRKIRPNYKLLHGEYSIAKGNRAEVRISEYLRRAGLENELMPNHAAYDIQLQNGLRMDVKVAYKSMCPPSQYAPFYNFHIDLARRGPYADVFALYIPATGDIYFIPLEALPARCDMFHVPAMPEESRLRQHRTKYEQYRNNTDYLFAAERNYRELFREKKAKVASQQK